MMSQEEWDALPAGTMVRVRFEERTRLEPYVATRVRNGGASAGGYGLFSGRGWSDILKSWPIVEIELLYVPGEEN